MSTAANIAKASSPLEGPVQQIVDNPQYLTGEHARKLFDILKRQFSTLFSDKVDTNVLATQLKRMGESIDKLVAGAIGGETTDLKRVVDAQTQYFRLLAKFNDALVANERLQAIEAATIEALQELGNKPIHEEFLRKFALKLEEKTQK